MVSSATARRPRRGRRSHRGSPSRRDGRPPGCVSRRHRLLVRRRPRTAEAGREPRERSRVKVGRGGRLHYRLRRRNKRTGATGTSISAASGGHDRRSSLAGASPRDRAAHQGVHRGRVPAPRPATRKHLRGGDWTFDGHGECRAVVRSRQGPIVLTVAGGDRTRSRASIRPPRSGVMMLEPVGVISCSTSLSDCRRKPPEQLIFPDARQLL